MLFCLVQLLHMYYVLYTFLWLQWLFCSVIGAVIGIGSIKCRVSCIEICLTNMEHGVNYGRYRTITQNHLKSKQLLWQCITARVLKDTYRDHHKTYKVALTLYFNFDKLSLYLFLYIKMSVLTKAKCSYNI